MVVSVGRSPVVVVVVLVQGGMVGGQAGHHQKLLPPLLCAPLAASCLPTVSRDGSARIVLRHLHLKTRAVY